MIASEHFLADRHRPLEQRLGLRVTLLPLIKRRQIAQSGGDRGSFEAEQFFMIASDRRYNGSASASRHWLP